MTQNISTPKQMITEPAWLDVLRIVLSILLVWKGLNFIIEASHLESIIQQTGIGEYSQLSGIIAAVVSIVTLLCAIFIMVGFFTRISSFIQIAIIIIALVFVYLENIERNSFEIISTIIVLLLLIYFTIKGSGRISFDEFLRKGTVSDHPQKLND